MVRFVADECAEPWLRSRLPWESGTTTKHWNRSKTIWGRWGLRDRCAALRDGTHKLRPVRRHLRRQRLAASVAGGSFGSRMDWRSVCCRRRWGRCRDFDLWL